MKKKWRREYNIDTFVISHQLEPEAVQVTDLNNSSIKIKFSMKKKHEENNTALIRTSN